MQTKDAKRSTGNNNPFSVWLTEAVAADGRSRRAIADDAGISDTYLRRLMCHPKHGARRLGADDAVVASLARTLGVSKKFAIGLMAEQRINALDAKKAKLSKRIPITKPRAQEMEARA